MITKCNAEKLLVHQINNMYGIDELEEKQISKNYNCVLQKLNVCFSCIKNKYYHDESGEVLFNPLHTAQWTLFLYHMAHTLWQESKQNMDLCDKIYGLSKCISSADIYYEVNLPEVLFFDHPQGSVIGRANYSNYFSFGQGCTIGNNKGKYPSFGEHVSMFSHSKILGNCKIGNHVIFSANSYVKDQNIPPCSIVFGMYPNIAIQPITVEKFYELTSEKFFVKHDDEIN